MCARWRRGRPPVLVIASGSLKRGGGGSVSGATGSGCRCASAGLECVTGIHGLAEVVGAHSGTGPSLWLRSVSCREPAAPSGWQPLPRLVVPMQPSTSRRDRLERSSTSPWDSLGGTAVGDALKDSARRCGRLRLNSAGDVSPGCPCLSGLRDSRLAHESRALSTSQVGELGALTLDLSR